MSPDDILAANLWPWPDPLLKRDRAGKLIFVNAAFLQLYGGRVEDWFGRVITGWPVPNLQGPQRFETRTGDGPNQAIYDWVETVMADGNTMAVARNVTIFIKPPAAITPEVAPVAAVIANSAPQIDEAPALAPLAQSTQPVPTVQEKQSGYEDTLDNDAEDYSYETIEIKSPAPAAKAETKPVALAPPAEKPQEERRMIERRALPIEDSTSVLGSNWRDQVIAKAIGEEAAPSEISEPQTAAKKEAPPAQIEEPKKVGDGLNILLAEDNAINALLTRTLLEADGAIVETVEDGSLAVKAVQSGVYDLIFMDMRMPVMDGLESTRKIRALGKTMPIIALTANAFDDDRNACFDSGMNDFMTKPVSADELSEMVATWVKNKNEKEKLAS